MLGVVLQCLEEAEGRRLTNVVIPADVEPLNRPERLRQLSHSPSLPKRDQMPSELSEVEIAEVRIELAIRGVLRPLSALR